MCKPLVKTGNFLFACTAACRATSAQPGGHHFSLAVRFQLISYPCVLVMFQLRLQSLSFCLTKLCKSGSSVTFLPYFAEVLACRCHLEHQQLKTTFLLCFLGSRTYLLYRPDSFNLVASSKYQVISLHCHQEGGISITIGRHGSNQIKLYTWDSENERTPLI